MGARRGLRGGAALAAWLALGIQACGGAPPARVVVLVSLDTTRADHLGAYGGRALTPELDAFAAEAIVFESAATPATVTLPAHVSMFTGTWQTRHGAPRNGYTVNEANRMLPERLAEAGFRSVGVSAAVALSSLLGFDQGFDVWDQDPERLAGHAVANREARRAEQITDAALEQIAAFEGEPLFLFVHYVDPHLPYDPPEPWRSMYGPVGDLVGTQEVVAAYWSGAAAPDRATGPDETERALARLYAGEVSYLDHHVGRLFRGLRERGLYDRALIVVTSDHGETFWEHPDRWSHGFSAYETLVHVPLLIRLPGGERGGARVSEVVSLVDLSPTVLEHLGLVRPPDLDGRSLLPLLRGEAFERGPVFSEGPQPRSPRRPRSVRSGRWKYLVRGQHAELYDLASDPEETRNLLETDEVPAGRAEELAAALEAWQAAASPLPSRYFPREKPRREDPQARDRRAMWEQLRALGYLGEEP